jgi:hypothetical protein
LGDWTVTRGGDLGGENVTIDVGLGLGLLRGVRRVLIPGVSGSGPLKSDRWGDDVCGPLSRAISREIRPSSRDLWSSSLSCVVGDACIGEVIEGVSEDLFIFSILSK